MPEPIILSTWTFGQKANTAGWPYLNRPKASSLDAVEQACRAVEADLEVNCVGRGGCPDRSGEVSLDASIMQSPSRCGSVCYVRRFEHPVTIARMVMERLHIVLLAGDGADRFALRQGLTPANLLTENARAMWQRWAVDHPVAQYLDDAACFPPTNHEECRTMAGEEALPHNRYHDTVGVLALDATGKLSGACSTSGLPFKAPGRVGDSPIIGHGLYVDPLRGAAVATGKGELVMGVCGSFLAVELMGRGASPADAAREVLQRVADSYELREEDQVAIIAMRPSGQWSSASLRPGYHTAVRTSTRDELADPECVLLP
jgi:isoaspartyl peptidase/L-asparaginase-like protein (Ntn-hydrolase superfamily)